MRVFKIKQGNVLIINGNKRYFDTVENFKLDSKLTLEGFNEVIYDNYQECCVINKEFKEYPNDVFEGYIDNVDIYIKIKEKKEDAKLVKPTLDELKASKIDEMKAERNIREQQIIEYNGNTFDYDGLARERLLLGRQSLEDAGVEDAKLKWTCADNEITYLGIEDFKGINTVAATRSIMLHDTYNKLKVLINSCGTKEELEQVTFDTDVSMLSYGE